MSTPSNLKESSQPQPCSLLKMTLAELKVQGRITIPLVVMNLTWFAKIAITTAFLGRLGELQLAGATLGFTFANVTGFSVLNGLCCAMEPICGQAYGAKNFKLLHKTLLMTIALLLLVTLPVSLLWLNVEGILVRFGQQKDISATAKNYLFYLLPGLVINSFLCPLKAYLSSQSITIPIMFSSSLALALHVPINILLSKARGLEGVSMAVWISDLIIVILLALYVLRMESSKEERWKEGGWWDQSVQDWIKLLKLSGPCCLTTCLEWWCYEILILLTGRLKNAKQAVGVVAIVLNFDYLLFSVMLSLATCASIRVSNQLGANQAGPAYQSACISLAVGVVSGSMGGLATVAARSFWGPLFTHDKGIISGVKKTMLIMALLELANFPLAVCGGILRGTARPWLAMYGNIGGFYFLALPLGIVLGFKAKLGLRGLLIGFLIGISVCLMLLIVFLIRINWDVEASKAQKLACSMQEDVKEGDAHPKTKETIINDATEINQ